MSLTKKITLLSSNDESFEVDEAVVVEWQTIKRIIEGGCADCRIPLPNVTSRILAKVIEYCKKHVESTKSDDHTAEYDLKAWDTEFVKVDQATLFDLMQAAKYLDIKGLLDLTCQTVADIIKGKTPEEVLIFSTSRMTSPVRKERRFAARIVGLLDDSASLC